jgi:hypothetical protein
MNDMKQKDDTTMKLLSHELDEARELAQELRNALRATLTTLVMRMVPNDMDVVERAHTALTRSKEVLNEA